MITPEVLRDSCSHTGYASGLVLIVWVLMLLAAIRLCTVNWWHSMSWNSTAKRLKRRKKFMTRAHSHMAAGDLKPVLCSTTTEMGQSRSKVIGLLILWCYTKFNFGSNYNRIMKHRHARVTVVNWGTIYFR